MMMDVDDEDSAAAGSNTLPDDPFEKLADEVVKVKGNENVDRAKFIEAVRKSMATAKFREASFGTQSFCIMASLDWVNLTLPRSAWDDFVDHAVDTNASHGTNTTSPRDESKSSLAKAFDAPYHDPFRQLDNLYEYIKKCSQAFITGTNWYSPYISICQSSGWGKSRLLRQLSRKASVLYVSFMSKKRRGQGYPRRTTKAIDFLCGGPQEWSQFKDRLKHAIECMRGFRYYLDFDEYGEDLWGAIKLNYEQAPKPQQIKLDFDPPKVDGKVFDKQQSDNLVIVVFDEAREMLDTQITKTVDDEEVKEILFLECRRHLISICSRECPVFGIFADTSSRISNYSPPAGELAPSAREVDGQRLFRPYIVTGNMDARAEGAAETDWMKDDYICNLGRPLWGSVEQPLKLAANKLTLGKAHFPLSVLALFLARVGLFLSQVHVGTSELVANHMATLLAADAGRTGLLVTYVSDPVLSEGAILYWTDDTYVADYMLPEVRRALMYGQVLEGALGETVTITVILMAMDLARKSQNGSKSWASLRDFLEKLCGKGHEKTEKWFEGIPDAWVCTNHFIQWYREFTASDLEILAKRRAGCILPRNQEGADLVFPFVIRTDQHAMEIDTAPKKKINEAKQGRMEQEDDTGDQPKSPDGTTSFGMVVIQVKNCASHEDMRVVGYKLHNDYMFGTGETGKGFDNVHIVRVVMEIGLGRDGDSKPRQPEIIHVKVTKAANKVTISASNSSTLYQLETSPIEKNKDYNFLRLKGMDSIAFLAGKTKVRDALKVLLRGPIRPTKWWEANRDYGADTSDMPIYDLFHTKLCLGE